MNVFCVHCRLFSLDPMFLLIFVVFVYIQLNVPTSLFFSLSFTRFREMAFICSFVHSNKCVAFKITSLAWICMVQIFNSHVTHNQVTWFQKRIHKHTHQHIINIRSHLYVSQSWLAMLTQAKPSHQRFTMENSQKLSVECGYDAWTQRKEGWKKTICKVYWTSCICLSIRINCGWP